MASKNPTHGKKLTIGFGLVNINLAMKPLYESRSRPGGKFLAPDMGAVKQCYRHTVTGAVMERGELITGYLIPGTKDQYVTLDESVVDSLAAERTGRMEINKVVPFDTIDPAHLSSAYMCWSQDGSETAYDLLVAVLQESGQAAVATVVLTKTTQQIVLRWSDELGVLVAHLCEYSEQVRTNDLEAIKNTASSRTAPDQAMVDMAKNIFASLAGSFELDDVEDIYGTALTDAIAAKAAGTPITVKAGVPAAPVNDLLASLEASVKALKA